MQKENYRFPEANLIKGQAQIIKVKHRSVVVISCYLNFKKKN